MDYQDRRLDALEEAKFAVKLIEQDQLDLAAYTLARALDQVEICNIETLPDTYKRLCVYREK